MFPRQERKGHMSEWVLLSLSKLKSPPMWWIFCMCQGEMSLHACTHSSCVPCVKRSGQMLWAAHLFGGRFKGKVQGTSAASCCSFLSALFRLDSELGSSHDESWCYLHYVLIVAMQENVGVTSGRANKRILMRFHRHEVRDHNVLQCYIPVDLNRSSPRIRIHLVHLMLHSSHSKLHLSNS